jgi:hypothetical protein
MQVIPQKNLSSLPHFSSLSFHMLLDCVKIDTRKPRINGVIVGVSSTLYKICFVCNNNCVNFFFQEKLGDTQRCDDYPLFQDNARIFAKEVQAKGRYALARLSQQMQMLNGDWEPEWSSTCEKFIISFFKKSLASLFVLNARNDFACPTSPTKNSPR